MVVMGVPAERRRMVDRRCGREQRSTLDRRGRARRASATESPTEHVRNALQLLVQLRARGLLHLEDMEDLAAAVERLRLASSLLERRSG